MDNKIASTLIDLARRSIAIRLGIEHPAPALDDHALREPAATYVTLRRENRIRGRTGTLRAHRALADDIIANAVAAACSDPRFDPLSRDEFADTRIEICLLSGIEPIRVDEEAALLARLRPGIDGLIFEYGRHHSSFLPEVWKDVADAGEFFAQLKYQAGLPPDFWDRSVKIGRFTVSRCEENNPSR